MRVMVLVKANDQIEAGVLPTTGESAAMGRFNQELVNAGVMVDAAGLTPSSRGARVHLKGDQTAVIDGPFTETKELVAGYWMWEVGSMDEAIAWARRCPCDAGGGEMVLELRPVYGAEDFGEALTPELLEQEKRMRAEAAARHA